MTRRSGLREISVFQNLLLRRVLWPDGCDISTMDADSQRAIRELSESKREPLVALVAIAQASLRPVPIGCESMAAVVGGRGVRDNAIPGQ